MRDVKEGWKVLGEYVAKIRASQLLARVTVVVRTGRKSIDKAGLRERGQKEGQAGTVVWDLETSIVRPKGAIVWPRKEERSSPHSRLHLCSWEKNPLLFSSDVWSTIGSSYNVGTEW